MEMSNRVVIDCVKGPDPGKILQTITDNTLISQLNLKIRKRKNIFLSKNNNAQIQKLTIGMTE